ncbi:MAG: alpha/beta hydrolase [Pseudomonadota bacterium]
MTDGSSTALRHHDLGDVTFLERKGEGRTVVFLHGIGSNSDSFAPLFEQFPEGPRLIAWNAPGYLSSKPLAPAAPTAQDYAAALERFFDSLCLSEATLAGHSLGTLIAARFALRAPNRVSSIVLVAAARGYGVKPGEPLPPSAAKRLDDLGKQGPAAFAEERAPRLVFQPERNPSVVALVRKEMARINPDGYAQAVHMLASGNLAEDVAQLHQKPGFIIGAEDQITPMDQTNLAMRAWAEANGTMPRCISIAGAGHAVYGQATHAFMDAMMELVPDLHTKTPSHSEEELHGG